MRLNDLDKTSIKYYLSEDLKKDSSLNEHWDRIDNEFFKPWQKYLNEATLTPDQINQMFAAAEKETSSGGGNSTMLGKIVDKIIPDSFLGKLEKALPEPDPKAVADPEFEAKAAAAVNNLEAPAETKTGLMAVVKAAVKNPQAQAVVLSLVGGVLGGLMSKAGPLIATFFPGGGTAAVAITGAIVAGGVAIAAAKLQGKPWKEAFKGAIKPALAGAAGAVIGQFAAGIAGAAVDKVAGALSSNKPAGGDLGAANPAMAADNKTISALQKEYPPDKFEFSGSGDRITVIDRATGNPVRTLDGLQGQSMDTKTLADLANDPNKAVSAPPGAGPLSTGKADPGITDNPLSSPTLNKLAAKVAGGEVLTAQEMSYLDKIERSAVQMVDMTNPKGTSGIGSPNAELTLNTGEKVTGAQAAQLSTGYFDATQRLKMQAIELQGNAKYGTLKNSIERTGKKLSEGQVYLVFNKIVTRNNYLLTEGRLAEGPMDWLKTKAKNLTTKVTADKLNSAWQKAGSPTDSEELKKFLIDQGVATEVVDKVYTTMQLPAAGAADPAADAQKSQDAAALDPKQAETLYAKVKKEILTLDKKSQKQIAAYLQKQLGTA